MLCSLAISVRVGPAYTVRGLMKWWHCFRSYGWGWLSSNLRSGCSRCIGELYRARRVPRRCVPQTCDSACCFTLAGDKHSTGREQVDIGAVHLNESPAGKVSTALRPISAAYACACRQRAQCADKKYLLTLQDLYRSMRTSRWRREALSPGESPACWNPTRAWPRPAHSTEIGSGLPPPGMDALPSAPECPVHGQEVRTRVGQRTHLAIPCCNDALSSRVVDQQREGALQVGNSVEDRLRQVRNSPVI